MINKEKIEAHSQEKYLEHESIIAGYNRTQLIAEVGEEEAQRIFGIGLWYDDPLQDGDSWSVIGLERRAAMHSEEAFDLIDALAHSDTNVKEITVSHSRMYLDETKENDYIQKKMMAQTLIRSEIIERLEWIASFKFGDNVEEWQKWAETRKREGFFVGR